MEKLTDEQLTYWEQMTENDASLKAIVIACLIAEVREGRRVVEIKEWGGTHIYNCSGCDKEFDAEGTMSGELPKHCCHCGVRLTWKD